MNEQVLVGPLVNSVVDSLETMLSLEQSKSILLVTTVCRTDFSLMGVSPVESE